MELMAFRILNTRFLDFCVVSVVWSVCVGCVCGF